MSASDTTQQPIDNEQVADETAKLAPNDTKVAGEQSLKVVS